MTSKTTPEFRARLAALPTEVRRQARQAYRRFLNDQSHPGLAFRRVHPRLHLYSARVGRHYRAVGEVDGDLIRWTWIGSHGEYDKLLDRA